MTFAFLQDLNAVDIHDLEYLQHLWFGCDGTQITGRHKGFLRRAGEKTGIGCPISLQRLVPSKSCKFGCILYHGNQPLLFFWVGGFLLRTLAPCPTRSAHSCIFSVETIFFSLKVDTGGRCEDFGTFGGIPEAVYLGLREAEVRFSVVGRMVQREPRSSSTRRIKPSCE